MPFLNACIYCHHLFCQINHIDNIQASFNNTSSYIGNNQGSLYIVSDYMGNIQGSENTISN